MDIFEQEYNQGLGETASDQFEKLAADIDGSNAMGKVNFPESPNQPSGAEGRTLGEALAIVERNREGRGKVTALANKVHPQLKHPVHRDVAPILSGGIQDPNGNDLNSVMRIKTAMEKMALDEKVTLAMVGTLIGAGAGAAAGALQTGAVGGIAGAVDAPKGRRLESAGRGLKSGAGMGAIMGAAGGAAMGALMPFSPRAAEVIGRGTGVAMLAGGVGVGIEEAKRVRTGIKPTFFQQKQYAAAIAKRKLRNT